MSIFREFNINMIPGKPPLIIHVSQYESDFVYTFNLVSGKSVLAIPDTAIAVIRGTKRDGNGYSVEAALDAENHKVVVMGDPQLTACAGKNVFELAIINNEKTICTANFFLDVERAPLDSDTIQSETVLHDLQAIINSAATATQAAEEASAAQETVIGILESGAEEAVDNWLDEHPEATTTVQDGAITEAKLATALKPKVLKDYVTPQMYGAVGDGETDDLSAFQSAITAMSDGDTMYIPSGEYVLSNTLTVNKNIHIIGEGVFKVTHQNPVLYLNELVSATVDVSGIEKDSRIFDYVEGTKSYSIGVLMENCDGCNVTVHNIIYTTTAFVLMASANKGCHYNTIACDKAQTFAGVEIVRTASGGWVNGNTVTRFRWMVNTWYDNVNLVSGYMIKSLSYATGSETEPYKNNANTFEHLVAEYGARSADYPILLCRLSCARGYRLEFDRAEILPKTSSLTDNSIYFTDSVYCVAVVWYSAGAIKYSVGSMGTDHNAVYQKSDYESLINSGIKSIISDVTVNPSLSYTQYWFSVIKKPATQSVRIFGELVADAEIANGSDIITGLPAARLGLNTMKIVTGTTATLWDAPTGITYYKLSIAGNATVLKNRGVIPSGTHLFVDFEYTIAEDAV